MTQAEQNSDNLSQYDLDDPHSYERTLIDALKMVWRDNIMYSGGFQPDYFYLAEYVHDIDPTLLESNYGHFIIKVGRTGDIDRRFRATPLRHNFRRIAHVELPSRYHASSLERAILNSIYRPVGQSLAEHIRLPHPSEYMLVDVHEYNLIVDILNHFFDDRPFPRQHPAG